MPHMRSLLCVLLLPLLALAAQEYRTVPPSASYALQSVSTAVNDSAAQDRCLALTFDDGPHKSCTKRLLDGLAQRGVQATFFLVGKNIEGNEDLVRRMQQEGHQVGNHTYSHVRLDQLDTADAQEEIGKTDAYLRGLLGEDTYWLRPPWGFISAENAAAVAVPMAHWSIDTEDWRVLDAEKVAESVIGTAQHGDIVLLHDTYADSVDAALMIVDTLMAEGYRFVTLKELFATMEVSPDSGTLYSSTVHTYPFM